MKILKLLNKKNLSIIIFLLASWQNAFSEDKPVDIWNTETIVQEGNLSGKETSIESINETSESSNSNIYKTQIQKKNNEIELDNNLQSQMTEIFGLYDPADFSLDINMWLNSNGDQLKNIFLKLEKINLSKDASEIMKISMLTNALIPNKNISDKEFLKFKSNWLIKNGDLDLIEKYLVKIKL